MFNSIRRFVREATSFCLKLFTVLMVLAAIYGYLNGEFEPDLIIATAICIVIDFCFEIKQTTGELVENTALLNKKLETIIENQIRLDSMPSETVDSREE